ncbi:zinc finger protein (macronuclear) [Tetrahymena thermophila SB210]|uniref:Zinc finger protein n=1 Tax=Tetrahymena thermophila (strain SB210) TaxID=312017 RepID=I7M7G8_TETTS|nr:zinc finger protein [Tetrahymena thermophila SB210]EAR92973.2 zinc finger protein [Tetrahymena thermophila SB210]|eukprot:XP_001013218.2 zinc finger protein [Tetrahymena thermophila SB210]
MNYKIISIIFLCAIKICFCNNCKPNQIYSLIAQSCLQCSNSCNTCFNTSESACVTCEYSLFKSSADSSSCVQKCQKSEFLNENLECVKCQVYGCLECDRNQVCAQCDQNFKLDIANNQCVLMNDVCPLLTNFIQGSSNLKQCNNECPQSFYQNMEALICEETVKCIQIEESQKLTFTQRVKQIKRINEDKYLVAGNACTFALVDNSWKVINIQILQNIADYDQIYTQNGVEYFQESFVIGNYIGCTAGSKLLVMNFQTFEVVSESDTNYDYFVLYLDQINQIVFLQSTQSETLLWYDVINNRVNQYQIDYLRISIFFQTQSNNTATYFMQKYDSSFQIGVLDEKRQFIIQSIDQYNLDSYILLDAKQYNDFLILISTTLNYDYEVIKIDIKQDVLALVQFQFRNAHSK